jgi:hypothetical protein
VRDGYDKLLIITKNVNIAITAHSFISIQYQQFVGEAKCGVDFLPALLRQKAM